MAIHCVNVNSAEIQALSKKISMHPAVIASKVAIWQDKNGIDKWPTEKDLVSLQQNKRKRLAYAEVLLPAWTSIFFGEEFRTNGSIDFNKVQKVLDSRGFEGIGYRIPTEDKYSLLPIKVIGFLPESGGGAIMLPAEITTIAGSDKH